jgi:very-short-patch-repair endonuclease
LWLDDAGIRLEPQPRIAGVGRLDGRVSPRLCLEIDGSQHAEGSARPSSSSGSGAGEIMSTGADASQVDGARQFEDDRRRDVAIVFAHQRSLRFTYRQLYRDWGTCLAAIRVLLAEESRVAQLERDSAALRKRRRSDRLRRLNRAGPP